MQAMVHCHLLHWSSWVGRSRNPCRPQPPHPPLPGLGAAQAVGCGPKDTPEKLEPGGHASLCCLPEEALGRHNLPEFPLWKLGTSPFMTFSRGGDGLGLGLWQ